MFKSVAFLKIPEVIFNGKPLMVKIMNGRPRIEFKESLHFGGVIETELNLFNFPQSVYKQLKKGMRVDFYHQWTPVNFQNGIPFFPVSNSENFVFSRRIISVPNSADNSGNDFVITLLLGGREPTKYWGKTLENKDFKNNTIKEVLLKLEENSDVYFDFENLSIENLNKKFIGGTPLTLGATIEAIRKQVGIHLIFDSRAQDTHITGNSKIKFFDSKNLARKIIDIRPSNLKINDFSGCIQTGNPPFTQSDGIASYESENFTKLSFQTFFNTKIGFGDWVITNTSESLPTNGISGLNFSPCVVEVQEIYSDYSSNGHKITTYKGQDKTKDYLEGDFKL